MTALAELGLRNVLLAGVLAVAVALVARVCRRPALAHALWLVVLLRLVMPPVWKVPVSAASLPASLDVPPVLVAAAVTDPPAIDCPGPPADPDDLPFDEEPIAVAELAAEPQTDLMERARLWLHGDGGTALARVWLAGAVVCLVGTAGAVRRFNRLLRFARPAPPALVRELDRVADRLGLRRRPGLWLVPGVISPMLWSVGRARLLFPADLLTQLDGPQRATLFAHELAHYRRRDHWVRWLEVLVLGLYWWCPVAWWARRSLREAEEQCCDAWVTSALTAADKTYATALVQTVTFLSQSRALPAMASGVGHVRHLRRRLTMIMRGTTPRSLSWSGLLAVLTVGLVGLPLAPAQSRPTPDDPEEQQARPASETDRKIAEVRRALRELEAQKAKESAEGQKRDLEALGRRFVELRQSVTTEKAAPEQMEQAERQVKERAAQVEELRARLREAEVKLREASTRLAQLGGRVPPEAVRRATVARPAIAVEGPARAVAPRAVTVPVVPRAPVAPGAEAPRARPPIPLEVQPALPGQPARARTSVATEATLDRLAQRLEALAKEMEEMRREMRRRDGSRD